MRTGCSLTVCCSLLPRGVSALGGCVCSGGCLVRGGVPGLGRGLSAPGGCAWSGGGLLWGGGSAPRGVSAPRRGVPGLGGSAPWWGVCSRGGIGPVSAPRGGVCSWGGVSALGGCLLPGGAWYRGCIPSCTEADTLLPPWTEFLTHACENITLAQLRCGR